MSNVKIPAYRQAGKYQMNVKFQSGILKRVQNDSLVMPNQVLNLIQDLRFRHLI